MVRNSLFIVFLLLFKLNVTATVLDSLQQELKKTEGAKKADVLNYISYEYLHLNQNTSLKYAQRALKIAQKVNNLPTIAQSYYRIGIAYDLMSNFNRALSFYNKALKTNEQLKNQEKISGCINSIGGVYYYMGNYKNALKFYLKSLTIREKLLKKNKTIKFEKIVAQSYNNIAMIYKVQKKYPKALKYYQLSLKVKKKINDQHGIIASLMNVGAVYLALKDYKLARNILEKALKIAKKENSIEDVGAILVNIGLTYKTPKQLHLALNYFNQAKEIYDTLQAPYTLGCIYTNISAVHIELNLHKKAIFYAKKALKIGKEIQSLRIQQEAQKSLATSFTNLHDFKNAYIHQNQLIILNDSLLNIDKNRALLELSTKYETHKKQQQIELLSTKNQLQKAIIAKEEDKNIILLSLLGLFIFISATIIMVIRQRKKMVEERSVLRIQNHIKEIDFLHAQLAQKVKKNIPLKIKVEGEIINEYLHSPLSEREIEVLKQIVTGKSNQEISDMLFVSVNTIKTHVMHIYKKLDVQNRTQAAARVIDLQIL